MIAYQNLAQTGTYEGWYNIYDGDQWGFGDNNWHGPGFGKFVELNDRWYWGHAFTNGSQAGAVSYSSRNGANNIHHWISPSTNNGSYKLHIISNGGGGGGGRPSAINSKVPPTESPCFFALSIIAIISFSLLLLIHLTGDLSAKLLI